MIGRIFIFRVICHLFLMDTLYSKDIRYLEKVLLKSRMKYTHKGLPFHVSSY